MPRRRAAVTQADVARAIRAMQDAGLPVVRVVVHADGVAIETAQEGDPMKPVALLDDGPDAEREEIIL
ncbi:hypothetical protein M446_0811 [Methylobacterium sp. 4-46]|uniref:hypothetical protein n=1 Tax=unclassified Methylobacterium TaxID=2615210 RepID=UPI000165C882|nr:MULTISPECIES: hypothetical protein [Methylobacterium]ACA15365.1 hypothetical protein M446_0811 [Methylobacterium sp. 4-46]WFT81088.1 hypothetical protein QA634_04070 [Methylobacterium nodulans]